MPTQYRQLESESEEEDEDRSGDTEDQLLEENQSRLDEKRNELTDAIKFAEMLEFQKKYEGIVTEEIFLEYANKFVKSAIEKYIKLFRDDEHLRRIRRAFRGCKVFDVLFLQSNPQPSLGTLHRLVDELVHFGFQEFTTTFIEDLKKEIPTLLELVRNMHYNFEGDDAEKEDHLLSGKVKKKLRRSRKRTMLINIDNTLH